MPKIRYSFPYEDSFHVYRTRWATVVSWLLIVLPFLGFGIGFMLLYEKSWGFSVFGAVFFLGGIGMLGQFPGLLRRINEEQGFIEWIVDRVVWPFPLGCPSRQRGILGQI